MGSYIAKTPPSVAQAAKPVASSCTAAVVTLDTKAEHVVEHVRALALPQCSLCLKRRAAPMHVFNRGRLADVLSPHSSSRGMISTAGSYALYAAYIPVQVARPVAISFIAESVTLAANLVHLFSPHDVSPSSEEPQAELSWETFWAAPAQDVSAGGVRDVVNPQLSNVERNTLLMVSSV